MPDTIRDKATIKDYTNYPTITIKDCRTEPYRENAVYTHISPFDSQESFGPDVTLRTQNNKGIVCIVDTVTYRVPYGIYDLNVYDNIPGSDSTSLDSVVITLKSGQNYTYYITDKNIVPYDFNTVPS